jgi:Single-strand binding protein family
MASSNINRVVLTGNLTADPDLRSLPSGTNVCNMRVASNTRRKDASTGEWVDKPNYFDIVVWGAQGENCARYLTKGRPIGGRRAPGLVRVRSTGPLQAPGRTDHRRHRAVPRQLGTSHQRRHCALGGRAHNGS